MDPKSTALTLLKIAAALFPPIAELLHDLLGQSSASNLPLAQEIRQQLPVVGESARVELELDEPGGP